MKRLVPKNVSYTENFTLLENVNMTSKREEVFSVMK